MIGIMLQAEEICPLLLISGDYSYFNNSRKEYSSLQFKEFPDPLFAILHSILI